MSDLHLFNSFQLNVRPESENSGEEFYQVELLRDNEVILSRRLRPEEYKIFITSLQPKKMTAA